MKRFRLIEEHSALPGLSPEQAEADRVDYIACIRQVIRSPLNPQAGVGLEEMERGLRVLKALDGKRTGDILELEDADHRHLCEKVRNARWAVVDERLVRFSHTILDATETVLDDPPRPAAPISGTADDPGAHTNGRSSPPVDGDITSRSKSLSSTGRVVGQPRPIRPRRKPGPA